MYPGSSNEGPRPVIALHNEVRQDHRPAVLHGDPRLDTGAAVLTGLDHQGGETVPRHRGVAHQEVALLRRSVGPELGEQEAASGDFLLQVPVLRRVATVDAGSDDGDRAPLRGEGRAMRRRVDAPGEPGDYRHGSEEHTSELQSLRHLV